MVLSSRTARYLSSTGYGRTVRRWRWTTRSRTARTTPADPVQRATLPATKPPVPPGLPLRHRRCRAPVRLRSPHTHSCHTAPITSTGPRRLQFKPRPDLSPSSAAVVLVLVVVVVAGSRGKSLWTARRLRPDDARLRNRPANSQTPAQLILLSCQRSPIV